MALFQIDYLKKTGALMKEAFTLKKYKAMHPAFAIFMGIFMSPFILLSLLLAGVLAIFTFICDLLLTPLKHIHSLLSTEGKSVMHATQFLIYAISWPIFFLLYFVFSWLYVVVYLLYALLSIVTYIFTLGGFKFHVSPNADSDDIAINVNGRFLALPIVFISIASVFFAVMLVFVVMIIIVEYVEDAEFFLLLTGIVGGAYSVFAALFSLLGFAPMYVEKEDTVCCSEAVEEALIEESVEEAEEAVVDAVEEDVVEETVAQEVAPEAEEVNA